jgi:hypothetical protein
MLVKRFKDLKNNTYKTISGDFENGGFAIDFYHPFQTDDYGEVLKTLDFERLWEGYLNVSIRQFQKEEIWEDRFGVWRALVLMTDLKAKIKNQKEGKSL